VPLHQEPKKKEKNRKTIGTYKIYWGSPAAGKGGGGRSPAAAPFPKALRGEKNEVKKKFTGGKGKKRGARNWKRSPVCKKRMPSRGDKGGPHLGGGSGKRWPVLCRKEKGPC